MHKFKLCNPSDVYCVVAHGVAMMSKSGSKGLAAYCVFEILRSTEREMLFSSDVIASHKPARFEFVSTGRENVRVVPK